jgi:ABC-type nickel/cobalt efflux system permease component RcnA
MPEANWLYVSAVLVAMVHTVLGPDHYLPFVAMSRAGRWPIRKTLTVTALCGTAHVFASGILGCIGLAMGLGVARLERWEAFRGELAAWLLVGFGLAYLAWGLRRAVRNRPHTHFHAHADGTLHTHEHAHHAEHVHVHGHSGARTPQPPMASWVLFTVFLFGPCESLIPLLMFPAARQDLFCLAVVVGLFSCTTVGTMIALVWLAEAIPFRLGSPLTRFGHAAAGFVIFACGMGITLGL